MLRPQTPAQKAAIATACRSTLWPMIERGQLKSVIHATFPLADAWRAHELMESSQHMGKIALEIAAG
jgi:NADPH:quinone reductase-like Zn-dependent oxidoreductase